ncbi:hypothetical protein L7F22_000148 [Adiantum nelumboides]|nr:hypothetical protein [Adiantum nelumboides]
MDSHSLGGARPRFGQGASCSAEGHHLLGKENKNSEAHGDGQNLFGEGRNLFGEGVEAKGEKEDLKKQEVFGCGSARRGTKLWEDILTNNSKLSGCIQKALALPVKDVQRMAIHCYTIYNILSQHVHAGKELASLQASSGGKVHFHRGPMSPQQVQVFICIGQAANIPIVEDPLTRPC